MELQGESFSVLLLAGVERSDVDALDQGRLQRDIELLQCLQHSDQGIDKCVVFDQCHVLVHVCSDGAVGQQGNPVVQEVISGRAGSVQEGQRAKGGTPLVPGPGETCSIIPRTKSEAGEVDSSP